MKKIISIMFIVVMLFVSGCKKEEEYQSIELTKDNYNDYLNLVFSKYQTDEGYDIYVAFQPKDNDYKFEGAYFVIETQTIDTIDTVGIVLDENGYSDGGYYIGSRTKYHDNFDISSQNKHQNYNYKKTHFDTIKGTVIVPVK